MKIGNYEVIRSLGRGGMGEVFLAHDPVCGRDVALKIIRSDWAHSKSMQERFLREAKTASQLTHPSIIPIYAIHQEKDITFYTMPYIEGETLKAILRTAREQEKKGELTHPIGSSVPALMRIFLNVCSAIAYTHSKRILHRDLKPENIIVGKYGEVIIVDWGLADTIGNPEIKSDSAKTTIPGTLSYMAPERAFGEPSSILSDIYSLGVILYQILTLQLPFHRKNLKEFRKEFKHEKLLDPAEISPNRDISPPLSDLVKACLEPDPSKRVQTMNELISDVEKYIEGLPEWILSATLCPNDKNDWEFQEHILLAKHMAIARQPDQMEWVSFMVSKDSFAENVCLETEITLGNSGAGIGFIIGKNLEDSFALWIGSETDHGTRLYRCNVEVLSHPEIALKKNQKQKVRIEKLDNLIRFFLNEKLQFGYLSHLPIFGKQIGVFYRDDDFQMEAIKIYIGSQNVMVNCLSIPDAFLAKKNFSQALIEYRRIAGAFPGRREGREAIFRMGITLLEEAQNKKKKQEKELLYSRALEAFEKLHGTPGAPLEYLGKSLVYKTTKEIDEEIKCLELALRRFRRHPLKYLLEENLLSRLHESARTNRRAAFQFALLALRYLPQIYSNPDHQTLINSLKKHLEPLYFLKRGGKPNLDMEIELAFWLDKPLTLLEFFEESPNCLHALLQLRYFDLIPEGLAVFCQTAPLLKAIKVAVEDEIIVKELIERAIDEQKPASVELLFSHFKDLETERIWTYLLKNQFTKAAKYFKKPPTEADPRFFLYGCLIAARKGEKKATEFLTDVMVTRYPAMTLLLSHYLLGRINLKKNELFYWEKVQLFRQLVLFYHCCKKRKLKHFFSKKIKRLRAKRYSEIL